MQRPPPHRCELSRDAHPQHCKPGGQNILETSLELRMLSSVTINCQVTKIVVNLGSQWSAL